MFRLPPRLDVLFGGASISQKSARELDFDDDASDARLGQCVLPRGEQHQPLHGSRGFIARTSVTRSSPRGAVQTGGASPFVHEPSAIQLLQARYHNLSFPLPSPRSVTSFSPWLIVPPAMVLLHPPETYLHTTWTVCVNSFHPTVGFFLSASSTLASENTVSRLSPQLRDCVQADASRLITLAEDGEWLVLYRGTPPTNPDQAICASVYRQLRAMYVPKDARCKRLTPQEAYEIAYDNTMSTRSIAQHIRLIALHIGGGSLGSPRDQRP